MHKSFSFGSVRNKLIQMSLQRRLKNRFRRTCTVLSCIHSCEYCIMTHFRQNVCPKGLVNPGLNRIFKGGSSLTHERERKTEKPEVMFSSFPMARLQTFPLTLGGRPCHHRSLTRRVPRLKQRAVNSVIKCAFYIGVIYTRTHSYLL